MASSKSPIDKLFIEMDVDGEKGDKSLDKAIRSLEGIKKALSGLDVDKLNKLSKNLKSLTSAVDTSKTTKIQQFVSDIKKLQSVDLSKLQSQLSSISGSAKGLSLPKLTQGTKGTTKVPDTSIKETQSDLDSISQKAKQTAQETSKIKVDTSSFEKAKQSAENLKREVGSIPTNLGNLTPEQVDEFSKQIRQAQKLKKNIELINEEYNRMGATPTKAGNLTSKQVEELSSSIRKAQKFRKNIELINKELGDKSSRSFFDRLKSGFKTAEKNTKSFIKYLNKIKSAFGSSKKSGQNFFEYLKTAFKGVLVYGGMFKLFMAVEQGFTEGIQNMARGSDKFNETMSSLATSMLYFKNLVAQIAAPLMNVLAPAIEFLTDKFADFADILAQTFAYLTGQDTYIKAIRTQVDYAGSLEGAASAADDAKDAVSEYKKSLQGFDEINLIPAADTSTDTPDSSKEDVTGIFEEKPLGESGILKKIRDFIDNVKALFSSGDFYGAGAMFAGGLNSIIDAGLNLDWEGKTQELSAKVSGVMQAINGFTENVNWEGLGENIGNGINSLFTIIDTALTTLDFNSLGRAFGKSVRGIFETVDFSNIGKTLSDGVHGAFQFLIGAIEEIDWEDVGNSIMDAINGIDWSTLGSNLGILLSDLFVGATDLLIGIIPQLPDLVTNLTNAVYSMIENIKWSDVVSSLSELIGSLNSMLVRLIITGPSNQVKFGAKLAEKLKQDISENFSWGDSPEEIINGLLSGISQTLSDIGNWIYENIVLPFVKGINEGFGITGDSSSVTEEKGGNLTNGMFNGIGDIWNKVKSKFDNFKTNVSNWFNQKITDFKNFGSRITSNISDGIGNIWRKVKSKFEDLIDNIKNFFRGKSIFNVKVSWDTQSFFGASIKVPKFSYYAQGGFPESGEAFIARENGAPEMVGRIGNRTAVANNDQIVASITQGVYQAVLSAFSQTNTNNDVTIQNNVTLDGEVVYQNFVKRHNSQVFMSGQSPLIVGG